MPSLKTALLAVTAFAALGASSLAHAQATPEAAEQAARPLTVPLAMRIRTYNENTPPRTEPVHRGAGTMRIHRLIAPGVLPSNVGFFERGVLMPKSSIGHHFHLTSEETFFILDGDAEFTINGRTSVIKGPAAVPVRMGDSHAVYNPSDKPMIWLDVAVNETPGIGGGFDLGDPRVGVPLDPIPTFINARFDPALLRDSPNYLGGKGVVKHRRIYGPTIYLTPWSYVDHIVIPPGASIGPNALAEMTEMYFVLSGEGTVTMGQETAPMRKDQVIPISLGESKSFAASPNTPMELLVVGVARDAAAKKTFTLTAPRFGGPPAPPARPAPAR